MNNQSCMHCFVSGKVQGVWYRASAKKYAQKLGINGWARNLPDGRVEVLACGYHDQLEQFYLWLQEGPQFAIVKECTRQRVAWQECEGFDTF